MIRALAAILLSASIARATEPKPTASVLDPAVSDFPAAQAEIMGEVIRDTVVQSGLYRVQDRAAMREILAQQQINASEICDESCAVEQGRLLQVRFLISATVRKVEDEGWISIRLTNVETGEVVGTARGSCAATVKEMARLAEELTRSVLTGEKRPGPPPRVEAAPPPPPPPALTVEAGETIHFKTGDPKQSFELEVSTAAGTQRCRVAAGETCLLRGLRAGPARLSVRGSATFTKTINVPYGASVGTVQDISSQLLWFGLAGLGVMGLSVPVIGYAVNNCVWEDAGGPRFCPEPTLANVALIAGSVLAILGGAFVYASLATESEMVMIGGESQGGTAPSAGKMRLERLNVGATREGTPTFGARFRF